MSLTVKAGTNVPLVFTFPGGDITGGQITIELDGTPVVGPTSAGLGEVGSDEGIYTYVWQTTTSTDAGTYTATVSGTDGGPVEQSVTVYVTTIQTYASLDQLKRRVSIPDGDEVDDEALLDALEDVTQGIDQACERVFTRDETATERTYDGGKTILFVDDFWSTDGLVINGVPWPVSGMTLLPRNGVVAGVAGWPYNRIRATVPFPDDSTIEAPWGWAQIPRPVHQSALILAAETFSLKDAPWGVAGWGGDFAVRIRNNPVVAAKLAPYMLLPAKGL